LTHAAGRLKSASGFSSGVRFVARQRAQRHKLMKYSFTNTTKSEVMYDLKS